MILTPAVRDTFDLSKESDKTKEQYGKDSVGSSLLLAHRLVEAGSRFVTAAGFHSTSWDTHSDNDRGHRDCNCEGANHAESTAVALLGNQRFDL